MFVERTVDRRVGQLVELTRHMAKADRDQIL